MLQVLCLMKSNDSFNRIKLQVENVDLEEYITCIETLQEKIVLNEYDIAIVDEKIWWKEEAINLLEKRGIEILYFTGNFEDVINEITDRIPPEPEYEPNNEGSYSSNINSYKPEIKYIEKVVEVPVEKIILKSRNIKQELMSVFSTDTLTLRDSFICNAAALLSKDVDKRILVVDITNFGNLINHYEIQEFNKLEALEIENFNANTILDCVNKVKGFECLHLLRVNNKTLTKKNVKSILFAARDYDYILFNIENDINNLTVKFVLNLCHKIFIITEPLYLAAKNNLDIIKSLLENGQIETNINIILSGIDPLDKDTILYMYNGFKIGFINRDLHLLSINNKKFAIDNAKELKIFEELLNLKNNKKRKLFLK